MTLFSFFSRKTLSSKTRRQSQSSLKWQRPMLEPLEDRILLSGGLYVANTRLGDNTIHHFSPTGEDLGGFAANGNEPVGLAFDSAGNLYASLTLDNVIRKFSSNGTDLGIFANTGLASPSGMVFDSNGNLYVVNIHSDRQEGFIRKFSPTGTDLGSVVSHLTLDYSIAMDSSDNFYVDDFGARGIHKFSSSGADLGVIGVGLFGQSDTIGGIAFDSDGNLYAGDTDANFIRKFSPTGDDMGTFANTGLSNPREIAFDSDKNLYVTNSANNTIREFSPGGEDLGNFAVTGLNEPLGLAFGQNFDVSGFPSLTVAGAAAPFTVTVKDGFGKIATGYRGTVTFSSSDDHAVLPVNYTFTAADQGRHAFAAALKTAGAQDLSATDITCNTVTGTQAGILVIPAGLDHFSVEAPDTIEAGAALPITVAARDPYDNVVQGYQGTISFSSTDGQATLPGPYTFTTADLGTHSFSGLILRTAGSRTVTVRDGTSGPAGSATIAVTAAAADHLLFLQQPSDTAVGLTISPALTVEIVDQFGNVVTSDDSDTVTLSIGNNPGGGTLSGTLTVTVSGGIATFSDLSIDQIGDGYTLLAVTDGLSSAESSPFRITM